jgi:chromosome segregation ATPase
MSKELLVKVDLSHLDATIEALLARITSLETGMASMITQNYKLKETTTRLKETNSLQIANLHNEIEAMSNQCESANEHRNEIEVRIEKIEVKVGGVAKRCEEGKEASTSLQLGLEALDEKVPPQFQSHPIVCIYYSTQPSCILPPPPPPPSFAMSMYLDDCMCDKLGQPY